LTGADIVVSIILTHSGKESVKRGKAIQAVRSGAATITAAAAQFGVSRVTLHRWPSCLPFDIAFQVSRFELSPLPNEDVAKPPRFDLGDQCRPRYAEPLASFALRNEQPINHRLLESLATQAAAQKGIMLLEAR
jgi:hypothetical protein